MNIEFILTYHSTELFSTYYWKYNDYSLYRIATDRNFQAEAKILVYTVK